VSWLPDDWEADSRGYGACAYLTHKPCGFRTSMPYDLVLDTAPFGRQQARNLVWHHKCEE